MSVKKLEKVLERMAVGEDVILIRQGHRARRSDRNPQCGGSGPGGGQGALSQRMGPAGRAL